VTRRSLQITGIILIVLSISIHAAYAFIYEQKSLTITQTIKKVYYISVLRPNGVGSSTRLTPYGAPTDWQCVNDSGNGDGDATYVYSTSNGWRDDTYQIQNHTSESGTILNVTVNIRVRSAGGTGQAMTEIRTYNTVYSGAQNTLTTSYTLYSTTYSTNPFTGNAWTWGEIDALEAGARLRATGSRCTQVWIEVEYKIY
jgi:hypothetical protein